MSEDAAAEGGGDTADTGVARGTPTPRQILEALLFSSSDPLSLDRLRDAAGLDDGHQAREVLQDLSREYDDTGRAFSLDEIAGGWQLLTRPQYAPHLARLKRRPEKARLSSAALETLAVVAYRQPVFRAEIEAIRGVKAAPILRTLLDHRMIKITGRADVPGRPLQYGTTQHFLETFGLESLKDLPSVKEFRSL